MSVNKEDVNAVTESAEDPATETAKQPEKEPLKSGFLDVSNYQIVDPLDYNGKPFEVNGAAVTALKLRKPKPFELSGIDIQSIGIGDINTTVEMMTRCCTPTLTTEQVNDLDLSVLTEASGALKGFFMGTTLAT